MTKHDVQDRFPGGKVEQEISMHRGIQWMIRVIGIMICVILIKAAPPDVNQRVWHYGLVSVLLWWMYTIGNPAAFICEKGIVIKRRPLNVREYFDHFVHNDNYYIYANYDAIVGFTPKWREMQAVDCHGGIYIVLLDLQLVSYKDKMALLEAVRRHRNNADDGNF